MAAEVAKAPKALELHRVSPGVRVFGGEASRIEAFSGGGISPLKFFGRLVFFVIQAQWAVAGGLSFPMEVCVVQT